MNKKNRLSKLSTIDILFIVQLTCFFVVVKIFTITLKKKKKGLSVYSTWMIKNLIYFVTIFQR